MNTEGPLFYYYMFICGSFGSKISVFQYVWYDSNANKIEKQTIIGNRLFYFRKKPIWTYSSKIKVPQCSYHDYVCMYVFVYALSLQSTPFELTSWNLNQEVYIWSRPNAIFTFLKFSFFEETCPFLQFS